MEGLHIAVQDVIVVGLYKGCNMAKVKGWDPILDMFSKRLSNWKASLLSIGVMLMLKRSLGSLRNQSCLKDKGGLGIAIYGYHQASSYFFNHVRPQGVWGRIVGSINTMHEKGIIPHSNLKRKVNNGLSTKFWTQTWIGNYSLQHQFPHLFRLALHQDCMIRDCWNNEWSWNWSRPISGGTLANQLQSLRSLMNNITLNDVDDIWIWSLRKSPFTVKDTRVHIDQFYLPGAHYATRWNRFLPKKVNIFIWRALRDRLLTRWNLSRRGIDLESLYCPTCDTSIETIDHTLWFCSLATSVWHRVFAWLDLQIPNPSNIHDFFGWLDDMRFSSSHKGLLEVICGVVLWSLWNFWNETVFEVSSPRRNVLFDKIVDCSHRWYSNRNKLSFVSWNNWLQNPLMAPIL
ncbi:RNA-directed DNA polymerase, eukaryota [Tanacetum coccineum]